MGFADTGGEPVDINTQVTLVDWAGEEPLNSQVLEVMRKKSKKLQEYACSGDEHTAKSVIDKIMSCFVERLDEGPGCLFVSDPSMDNPMGSALRSVQESPRLNRQERLLQVDKFLQSANISPEMRAAYLDSIKGMQYGEIYTNYFCKIWTQFWATLMATHIKEVLTDFCKDNQSLLKAWQGNQLAELLSLGDAAWLDLFRFKTNKKSAGDVSLNCCGYKGGPC